MRLIELQAQYQALTKSYETLQLEYLATKEELESLQSRYKSGSPIKKTYFFA